MKEPEYIEGPEGKRERFERGMAALFKVPKNGNWESKKEGRENSLPLARRNVPARIRRGFSHCVSRVLVASWRGD